MNIERILPGLYAIPLGGVNAFLIDSDELTLVDTGVINGSAGTILDAVRSIGRTNSDLQHILVTHSHPDHAGGLAELKRTTPALAYMHPIDAAIVRSGKVAPDLKPSPGMEDIFPALIGFMESEYEAAEIEHEVHDGEVLSIAGGIRAIHVPGHCAGQLAFLWGEHGGVLFAADTASNRVDLGYSLGYQDFEQGKLDLMKLASLDFEVACFGHGKTITDGASDMFRQKWGAV